MKILYIDPIINTATSSKYRYYDGLYNQLIKKHDVLLLRQAFNDLNQIINHTRFKPDIVIFGVGFFGNTRFFGKIDNLNIPTACFLFKPQNDLQQKLNFCKINDIDLIYTPIPDCEKYEEITKVKTILFPFGFDPEYFKPREIKKEFDFGFSGALHNSNLYPKDSFQVQNLRPKIGDILKNSTDLNVFWNSSDDASKAFIDSYEEYAMTVNRSKMWLATLAAFGDVTPRYYEVLGSGTVLFCQEIPEAYKFLLKNGINCVEFRNDLSNFKETILYYKNNPNRLEEISKNAVEFFHNNWTWRHRADCLIKEINKIS
jgi:spore maturation protein CgeB